MANTKVTGDLIASSTITAANLVSGTLDGLLNNYLTTNTYATQSYVTTAVNNLVDAAPASLDTLNELAAALNDDANFATTVTNALATKLNLSGGNITGNLSVDTNVLFVDAVNNKVGIGTSSPSQLLTLGGNVATQLSIVSSTNTGSSQIYFGDSDSVFRGLVNYEHSGDFMALYTSATERMRITSTGNVGIGTSSPNSVFEAAGTFSNDHGVLRNPGSDQMIIAEHVGAANPVPFAVRHSNSQSDTADTFGILHIDRNGAGVGGGSNLYFRRQNSAGEWIEYGGLGARIEDSTYGSEDGSLHFYTISGGISRSEKMRITSGGDVLIGTTTAGQTNSNSLAIRNTSGTANPNTIQISHINGSVSGTLYSYFIYNGLGIGSITQNGTSGVAYNTSSDYRLKENVVPMDGALKRVGQLQPSRFNFIVDPNTTVDGFLAHEVQEVVPEAITGEKDAVDEEGNPIYQGIDQSKLTPLLTAAIQELKDIVDQQQIEIDNLKAQLNG